MKKITNFLFSMSFMGFLVLFMAVSLATATFIENDFGPEGARAMVYNTHWFELLLVLIMVNLVGNMFINKVYKKKKFTIFLFHISFLLIFFGAAVTRYISYEGSMHIRDGASSDYILSSESFIYGTALKDGQKVTFYKKANISDVRKSHFHKKISIGDQNFTVKLK
ncbi:MAG: cytochrome C biogenesis protein, partial [Nitrospiraceae bacterium]|nr:cytochrome C biogenesis protein [Nitrospiraceae bacterium]